MEIRFPVISKPEFAAKSSTCGEQGGKETSAMNVDNFNHNSHLIHPPD